MFSDAWSSASRVEKLSASGRSPAFWCAFCRSGCIGRRSLSSAVRRPDYAACKVGIAAITSANPRSAPHKSWACCIASQNPAPFPHNLPNRNAISGVTPASSARIRCKVCRDTCKWRAAALTLSRKAGNTSSPRMAPGWVGARAAKRTGVAWVNGNSPDQRQQHSCRASRKSGTTGH